MPRELLQASAVKVNMGTGCLFQPLSPQFTYVLTARHCLLGHEQSPPYNRVPVESIEVYSYSETDAVTRLTVLDYVYSEIEDQDIAIIIVEKVAGYYQTASCSEPEWDEEGLAFGYPAFRSSDSRPVEYLTCRLRLNRVQAFTFDIDAQGPLASFNRAGIDNAKGFSGAGLYVRRGDQDLLVGILTQVKNPDSIFDRLTAVCLEAYSKLLNASMYSGAALPTLVPDHLASFSNYQGLERVQGASLPDAEVTTALLFDPIQFRLLFRPDYTPAYEPYYVQRTSDELIGRSLLSPKNIWLYGASGLGKTCLVTRNLLRQAVPFVYCYLTALPNPRDASSILYHIAEDIIEQYPDPLGQFIYPESRPVKYLARLLANRFPHEDFIICIDEIQIADTSIFAEFVQQVAAVCAEYRNCRAGAGNLKFIISTIQPPTAFHSNSAKLGESFTLLELPSWGPAEMGRLLAGMNRAGQLLTLEDLSLVQGACRSPRVAKDIVHQYALNYPQQALTQVVAHVVTGI